MRLLALVVLGAAPAFFHAHLTCSLPRANDVVRAAPVEIRLAFSERPTVKLSSIKLLRSDNSVVPLGPVTGDKDPLVVMAKVPGALPIGTYAVVWKTAAHDGHVIRGRYVFTYSTTARAPRDSASPTAASARDLHDHH
ncbi:MAG: copper resistance protein CopC [Gemmatimonadales bacterium]|nr:copper resistance protein CopC [Gemmatimonadales bacterium]